MSRPENKTSKTEAAAPASEATVHPGETLDQPIPADPIPTPAPGAAAVAPKKSVEEWAKAKGMFHEFTEGKLGPRARPKQPKPLIHNPKFVHFHRARRSNHWAPNEEMTEAEFDAKVAEADAHIYR